MPLSEHVYCVAIAFKITELVEQRICIEFCVKLEHSSGETIWMIQKAATMGNWWLAASSQQCACLRVSSHAEFFGGTSNHPGDSAPYSPDLASCDFWHFPKVKSPLKGKTFQTIDEIQENMAGQLMVIGRTVWGPRVPIVKGTEASLSCVQCSLYLVSCSINVPFSYYMVGYLLDRLQIPAFLEECLAHYRPLVNICWIYKQTNIRRFTRI